MEKLTKVGMIGAADRIEPVYRWMESADRFFEILWIVAEGTGNLFSEYLRKRCRIVELEQILTLDFEAVDEIYIFSVHFNNIKNILKRVHIQEHMILDEGCLIKSLKPREMMQYQKQVIFCKDQMKYIRHGVEVGEFTYGVPEIWMWNDNEQVSIGKFCSISSNVRIFGGGEHRLDWVTTYPFNVFFQEYSSITGHPSSKGKVRIGNDVWIGFGATVLSGVTVGDGAVIGNGSIVTKDVPPYAIVAGNPAKILKHRFDEGIIDKLLEIRWWDWEYEDIYRAIPLLQSGKLEKVFELYEEIL